MEQREILKRLRLAGTTLEGDKPVVVALTYIKGISHTLASAIADKAGVDRWALLGTLSEEELAKLEEVIRDPAKFGIPWWLLNRQRDPVDGQSKLLIGDELDFTMKQDIEKMKKMKCWKGIRHALGLKVRGQRTKTTGRVGRTVGYQRKRR
ncbi:MAG TPA: 30S ribosomal protein S13 [Candidatus Korarchaeota archaeon]|nr:30S ribosomal protein S13 [Candidatus Korarchaeota archaeon]